MAEILRTDVEELITLAVSQMKEQGYIPKYVYVSYAVLRVLGEPIKFLGLKVIPSDLLPDNQVLVTQHEAH